MIIMTKMAVSSYVKQHFKGPYLQK